MTYLTGHNIGLDGVLAQQSNYNRHGFRTAYQKMSVVFRTVRMYTKEEPQRISRNRIFGVTTFELG